LQRDTARSFSCHDALPAALGVGGRHAPAAADHIDLLLSLPGLTGQSSTRGLCLLDRPVKPGDDSGMVSTQANNL
jgi:hypothetical protein